MTSIKSIDDDSAAPVAGDALATVTDEAYPRVVWVGMSTQCSLDEILTLLQFR